MKTIVKTAALVLLVSGCLQLAAQPVKEPKQAMRDRIESQRIAFITEKLELTPAEAQAFWPVYNEYKSKQKELRKQFLRSEDIEWANIDNLTDKEATEFADSQLVFAQKQLDLRKEYHGKFKAVLPPRKVLKLYQSEREFQKNLMNRLKDRPGGQPGMNPRRMAPGN